VVIHSNVVVVQGELVQPNIEYIYFYTFVLAMKDVVYETDKMAAALRNLFGEKDHLKGIWDALNSVKVE
jgi:hypothetical protein